MFLLTFFLIFFATRCYGNIGEEGSYGYQGLQTAKYKENDLHPLLQQNYISHTTNNGAFLENLSNKKLTSLKVALYFSATGKTESVSRGRDHNKSNRMDRKR